MDVSLIRRLPFSRWRIPISCQEREGAPFHPAAERPTRISEVFGKEAQRPVARGGESQTGDEPAAGSVIMVRARLLELFLGGGHLSSGELPNPPPDRLRAGGESKDEMVRFFPAVRLQDVALEVLQHLAVLGPGGVDVRVSKVDGHGRPPRLVMLK